MNLINKILFVLPIFAMMGNANAQITDPSKAFTLNAIKSIDEVEITITPANGFFLYKDKIHFFDGNSTNQLKIKNISGKSELKKFPYAPSHHVYSTPVQFYIPKPSTQLLKIQYQGCSTDGVCLPPQIKYFKVTND